MQAASLCAGACTQAVTPDGEVVATSAASSVEHQDGALYTWGPGAPQATLPLPVTFFLGGAKGGYREKFVNVRAVEPSTGVRGLLWLRALRVTCIAPHRWWFHSVPST